MKIAILGAGAWGTALARAFAMRTHCTLWGRDPVAVAEWQRHRENPRYLPGRPFPAPLEVSADLNRTLEGAKLAILTVPLHAFRGLLARVADTQPTVPLLWACKGIEVGTGALPHEIVASLPALSGPHGVLSGPSFAEEIADGLPAALTLASFDDSFARTWARLLHSQRLRIYSSTDLIGVEVAGALKNVIAIAAGLSDGLGLGANARAALITRGLAEISRLGVKLGGRTETFMGLAGLGDLVLTCTGTLSRNYRVGLGLAQGTPLPVILHDLGHVAEGVPCAGAALERARPFSDLELPITQAVHGVLEGRISALQAVERLMARDPRSE